MKKMLVALPIVMALLPNGLNASPARQTFNSYVIRAVEMIATQRERGGYNMGAAYTRQLSYGDDVIPPTPSDKDPPTATMCVAAISEVIIEAINFYENDIKKTDIYDDKLGVSNWTKGSRLSLKAYLFELPDKKNIFDYQPGDVPASRDEDGDPIFMLSRGTGQSFAIFKMGEELKFDQLQKGDFVNFNRTNGTGHAVVFISYIGANNKYTQKYDPTVIGFEYFSAQGHGRRDAGFGYRDAYFGSHPPAHTPHWVRDSTIISSNKLLFLNGGRLWMPNEWRVSEALAEIRKKIDAKIPASGTKAAQVSTAVTEELPPTSVNFDN